MPRPSVDVVVPFRGDLEERQRVCQRMSRLRRDPQDTLLVVDNTPGRETAPRTEEAELGVVAATGLTTPAFARNRGAAYGSAPWLVFLDADTTPAPDLLDRYFDPPPGPRTALIAGGVLDQEAGPDAPVAARYAYLRGAMSQEDTFSFGLWGYPKSANIACRRSAFEAIGGFREDIRAAEDADLTFRLQAAGWEVERREGAAVVHASRDTVWGMVRQKALWGAGGAWQARVYPGSLPLAGGAGGLRWAAGATARELRAALRRRNRDALIYAVLRPLDQLAWELGRLLSNERQVSGLPEGRRKRGRSRRAGYGR